MTFPIAPRKHSYLRRNLRASYPFYKMLKGDYFEDDIEFEDRVRSAASHANKKYPSRYFSVKIIDDKLICVRME